MKRLFALLLLLPLSASAQTLQSGSGVGVGSSFSGGANNCVLFATNIINCVSGFTINSVGAVASTYFNANGSNGFQITNNAVNIQFPTTTMFANLINETAAIGYISDGLAANCGDASCTTFGTTVSAGGGALHLLVWNKGSGWTLIGK